MGQKMGTLEKICSDLDFKSGDLLSVEDIPNFHNKNVWLEKGEWLAASKRANVEKIFFIKNNPVAVFAKCGVSQTEKNKAFNRIWSLARPRLLFLVSPGEITVYDLAQKPFDFSENSNRKNKLRALVILHDIERVAQKLQDFHRDNIESGKIFENNRFGDLRNRADKSLIRDLKIVRSELIQKGLSGEKVKYAHALIARSIFIRYLEDRQILTEDYFLKVARQTVGWTDILRDETSCIVFDFLPNKPFYPRILKNKDFTYALFKSLARDFNGDMFPDVDTEKATVNQNHLDLVQELLYSNAGVQKKLFFYSYRFDIIPLDLISSIYEEFYHLSVNDDEKKKNIRQDGAYYTPPVLAEFVLSRTLTPEVLKKDPRVLDPACGSGIFLVEAFRRIVRYKQQEKNASLSFNELKEILQKQISGIEVNKEAARIAGFSLYLSMLHYLDPPSINEQIKQGNKLPKLIATKNHSRNHYHCIWPGNTFDVESIQSNTLWRERFGEQCADVIVGNPPWGAPGNKTDKATKNRERLMLEWCYKNDKPIGDKEPSQAFLWRTLDFLKDGGRAGMLVSAGVLFKHSLTTQAFREQWMDNVRLEEVFNFTHVRQFFFKRGISPFLSLCFIKGKQKDFPVTYCSAKQVIALKKTQAILFSKYDAHILRNEDLTSVKLWKNYWFGRHSDRLFIRKISRRKHLRSVVNKGASARGFQECKRSKKSEWLLKYRELPVSEFEKYIVIDDSMLITPPDWVESRGKNEEIYSGSRILIKRGVQQKQEPKGQIISNFVEEKFCFRNSIHCIKLSNMNKDNYLLLQGILWSSFARFFFFLTSSNWGLWHYDIHLEEIFDFPIGDLFEKSNKATRKIIVIVDKLRNYHPKKQDILNPYGVPEREIEIKRREWEIELDKAVFELYGLNEEQRDLIRDCCEVTLPFFYQPFDSIGIMPAVANNDRFWIENYTKIFARRWNAYLGNDEEMHAEVHVGAHGNMLAVEFFPADKGDDWNLKPKNDSWEYILGKIGKVLPQPKGTSQFLMDGLVHVISDDGIIIIKRNEKRFWTHSLAREDADATLCKAMLKDGRDS
jgi:type I restriction-modification system DNA methylase subunit